MAVVWAARGALGEVTEAVVAVVDASATVVEMVVAEARPPLHWTTYRRRSSQNIWVSC